MIWLVEILMKGKNGLVVDKVVALVLSLFCSLMKKKFGVLQPCIWVISRQSKWLVMSHLNSKAIHKADLSQSQGIKLHS
jgi:hypothetical protein